MATNQMRREAAKRKLERQQERRAAQAKRRQQVAIITSAAVVVVVVVGIVLLSTLTGGEADPAAADPTAAPTTEAAPARALGDCAFTPTPDEPAAKPAPVPPSGQTETTGTVAATLQTDRGAIPLTLDRATGPCAVESFVSLAGAGYFDGTPCHRLTTSESLKVLQCGDPTGLGTGGPGYTMNDEPPTSLATDPQSGASIYPRGTVAMAKTSAPDSGGSQFFLVYADSLLPPDYTVFGTIGEEGLAALDAVAAAGSDGSSGSPSDGAPVSAVTIQTATIG
ncbi:peptidylprolyl isomerase [Pseudonocardia lacus]|uniref:peptidylprolyl isomerase n=1 Tax=Pseudonocardia lacus TaxID=2835865 RepID=UPI001BDD75B3|nr:peptidylprolyl isomerase [Pseudonocardia lacus]